MYAEWGVDFVKVDDLSRPYHKEEIELIRNAIDQCDRPIVLSTSPGETPVDAAEHVRDHANMWRMVDDVWDTWGHLTHLMEISQRWYRYIAPGTWPDCDMIPLGRISIRGERGEDRMTRLSRDEQYSLMNFFTIFKSPLMFGGDLPSNDDFTLSLLTNEAVLKMHRESTDVHQVFQEDGKVAVTSENPKTGERYLALFNLNEGESSVVEVNLAEIGISDGCSVTDLWSGEDLGKYSGKFAVKLQSHASGLYTLKN
jgi:hypothetical protein